MPFGDTKVYDDLDVLKALQEMIRAKRLQLQNELEANLKARDALESLLNRPRMKTIALLSPMTKKVKGRKSGQLLRDFERNWENNEPSYVNIAMKHFRSFEPGDSLESLLQRAFDQASWDTCGFRALQEAVS